MIDPDAPIPVADQPTQPISSAATTIREWPPDPVRIRALAICKTKMGMHETAPNEGPIVDWCLREFTRRKAHELVRGKPAWAKWCCYFVAAGIREALALDDPRRAEWIQAMRSQIWGSCDAFYRWLDQRGMILPAGQPIATGDIFFTGRIGDLDHTGWVDSVGARTFDSCEGNHHDRVECVNRPIVGIPTFARLTW